VKQFQASLLGDLLSVIYLTIDDCSYLITVARRSVT